MAAYDSAVENAFLSSVTNIRRAAFSICYLRFGFSQCWRVPSRLCSVKLFCMNGSCLAKRQLLQDPRSQAPGGHKRENATAPTWRFCDTSVWKTPYFILFFSFLWCSIWTRSKLSGSFVASKLASEQDIRIFFYIFSPHLKSRKGTYSARGKWIIEIL